MARYQGGPKDYKPELKFQLRRKREGGDVLRPGKLEALGAAASRRETLILVHGFNNHQGEAEFAYQGFRLAQYSRQGAPLAGSLEKVLGDAFWPGDASFWGLFDKLDFSVYPKAVGKAKQSAAALSEAILKAPNLEKVSFVAHSLGCRVVMETVKILLEKGRPALGRLCLMAAAIPVEMLDAKGRFGKDLLGLQALGIPIHVLHSDQDNVLKWTFVSGQTMAGKDEFTERALGLQGPSPQMPGFKANISETKINGAGHSDYWGHELSEASLKAGEEIAAFFSFGDKRRKIPGRTIG